MRMVLGLVLIGVVGCGGNGGGAGGSGGDMSMANGTPCALTASGAVSGSWDCGTVSAVWTESSGLGAVAFVVSNGAPLTLLTVNLTRMGELTTGSYSDNDSGATSASVAQEAGTPPPTWAMSVGGSDPKQGSYTMSLATAARLVDTAQGKTYTVHGSADLTLVPQSGSGATGNLMLHATF